MRYQRAITLVELLIVISIIGVLGAVSAPALRSMNSNSHSDRLSQELQLDLSYARNQALTSAKLVNVKPLTAGWHQGWTINQTETDGSSTLLRQKGQNQALAKSGELTSTFTSSAFLVFDQQGRALKASGGSNTASTGTLGSFTVNVKGCSGNRKRVININYIGQIVTVSSPCE